MIQARLAATAVTARRRTMVPTRSGWSQSDHSPVDARSPVAATRRCCDSHHLKPMRHWSLLMNGYRYRFLHQHRHAHVRGPAPVARHAPIAPTVPQVAWPARCARHPNRNPSTRRRHAGPATRRAPIGGTSDMPAEPGRRARERLRCCRWGWEDLGLRVGMDMRVGLLVAALQRFEHLVGSKQLAWLTWWWWRSELICCSMLPQGSKYSSTLVKADCSNRSN